ncbi:MAG TPA: MFS transporter [Solirubrobacteraceae bacterium]|nr:MFS transporter [Solirubrobacteraceae bacterium]
MHRLGRQSAFSLLAGLLAALLFASSVPSPLYVVFQSEWHFSSITLTAVFAVYAIALLVALLVVGSISDHIGRRPTLYAGLVVEVVAMIAFANANSVEWLFAARILQGLATGTAMGALSAALLDLQPPDKPWLGGLMGAVAPMAGLALGALAAGLLVDYGPDPTRFIFWLLVGVFALAVVAVRAVPETVEADGQWRSSLRPRIAVPRGMRGPFLAALPTLTASWALGGLILALGGSLTATVLGATSHVAAGLPIVVLAGTSALVSIRLRDTPAQTTARWGLPALIVGVALALVALRAGSDALFLAGSAVAGLGFGPAFAGVFRTLTEMAPPDQRAALVSSVLTVSYLAFSLPAVIAGVAVTQFGLRDTAEVYGLSLIVVAAIALALSGSLGRTAAESEVLSNPAGARSSPR